MNRLWRGTVWLFLFLLLQSGAAWSDVTLDLGDASGDPGETKQIQVMFTNDGTAAGLEFFITHDTANLTQGDAVAGADLGGANLGNSAPPIKITIADFSPPLNSGELALVPFTIAANAPAGDYTIVPNSVQVVDATGTAVPTTATGGTITVNALPGSAELTPASHDYGSVQVGNTSASQTFVLTNTGGSAITVGTASTGSADFPIGLNDCPASLDAGNSCNIPVSFAPQAVGARTATLTVDTGAGQKQSALSGNGTAAPAPNLVLTPASMPFGAVNLGAQSGSQTATLENTGTADATGISVSITGTNSSDFKLQPAGNCGATLTPGSSCSINALFEPNAAGSRSANLQVDSSNAGSHTTALSGTGTTVVLGANPTSVAFGDVGVGGMASRQVDLSSDGTGPVDIDSIAIVGGTGYSQTNTCGVLPRTLQPTESCTVAVKFQPAAVGSDSATLRIGNSSENNPLDVPLTGDGVQAIVDLSPDPLDFPDQRVGTTSTARTVTLTNLGSAPVNITSIGAAAPYAVNGGTCAAGTPVAGSGGSCTIDVTFSPTALGSAPGTLSVVSDSPTTPDTVDLAGTGVAPAMDLTPSAIDFGSVDLGSSSAVHVATLANTGTDTMVISSAATAGDFFVQGTSCGNTLAAGANCSYDLVFTPASGGNANGTFTVATDAANSPRIVNLSGVGAAPAMTLSTHSLNFGAEMVGDTSAAQRVTVTSTGTANLTMGQATSSNGEFVIQGSSTCSNGQVLVPAASCYYDLTFTPAAEGAAAADLTVNAAPPVGSQVVTMGGAGYIPAVVGIQSLGNNQFQVNQAHGDPTLPLVVQYSVGGTAVPGQDYEVLSGHVTIPAGARSAPIVVVPLAGGSGSVRLTLVANANYTIDLNAATAIIQITIGPPIYPEPAPAISLWGTVLLGGLLGSIGAMRTRRRRMK